MNTVGDPTGTCSHNVTSAMSSPAMKEGFLNYAYLINGKLEQKKIKSSTYYNFLRRDYRMTALLEPFLRYLDFCTPVEIN